MKKLLKLGAFLLVMTVALGATFVRAFNSATHIYIAEGVFPNFRDKIDLYYGSIAPDLALYVARLEKWPTAFDNTHYDFIDLRSFAWDLTQRAFAKGWLTHNEKWGADYYAHIGYLPNNGMGYVVGKAEILSAETGIDLDFAHFAIEVVIDLLLKWNDDPKLGEKLLEANLFRSWEDRNLLVRVLVWKEKKTDWLTLASTELTFRNLVGRYALAFALPHPLDKEALIELGVQLAKEMYDIDVSHDELEMILNKAIEICQENYDDVIRGAIGGIKGRLGIP